MRNLRIQWLAVLPVLLWAFGCGGSSGSGPRESLDGAWLGEGTFAAPAGSEAMKAQLEVLTDGRYRFLILEPRVMMLAGFEEGTWEWSDGRLDLTPVEPEGGREGGGLFGGAPRNFRPKSLTVEAGNSALVLDDGPMQMRFLPNPEATRKLREEGEIE